MTYAEAIAQLYSMRQFGMKLGLEKPRRLAERIGNPHHSLRFIHVAGTNGKGSTCAFLESVYRHAGYRVGLFTSPHLVRFGERVQVNREEMTEEDVLRHLAVLHPICREFPADDAPTFFELVTAMGLLQFREKKCDVVIWETGLGGRLDATNIVTPLASLITNIGMDHQAWLGNTHELIAAEKAGIVKPGVPCFTSTEHPGALQVIRSTAERLGAPFFYVSPSDTDQPPLSEVTLSLPGEHQRINAALAVAAIRHLVPVLPVDQEALRSGLKNARWSGRFQVVQSGSGLRILDGAHNAEGAEALRQTVAKEFPGDRPELILGILRDKSWVEMLRILLPMASRVALVPVQSDRSLTPEELAASCRDLAPAIPVTIYPTLEAALESTASARLAVITGSLLLVGQALELLQVERNVGERGLNDWQSSQRHPKP